VIANYEQEADIFIAKNGAGKRRDVTTRGGVVIDEVEIWFEDALMA